MKRYSVLLVVLSLAPFSVLAQSAGPVGPAAEVKASYETLKGNVIKAAEKMPAEDYGFKPTADVRSFGRVVNHITEAQFHYCTGLDGGQFDAAKVPAETAPKDAIVEALKASFAECDKAYAGLNDGDLAETVAMGTRSRSRIGLAWGNVSHDNEQYATLSVYLRLKGLVPPTSEK